MLKISQHMAKKSQLSISQVRIATRLKGGGNSSNDKFTDEFQGERMLKISQHMAKLQARVY